MFLLAKDVSCFINLWLNQIWSFGQVRIFEFTKLMPDKPVSYKRCVTTRVPWKSFEMQKSFETCFCGATKSFWLSTSGSQWVFFGTSKFCWEFLDLQTPPNSLLVLKRFEVPCYFWKHFLFSFFKLNLRLTSWSMRQRKSAT